VSEWQIVRAVAEQEGLEAVDLGGAEVAAGPPRFTTLAGDG
jgi:hypothetical protein